MSHHRLALATIGAALTLDVILGITWAAVEHLPAGHGLYCSLANAVTVGCDLAPRTTAGYAVNAIEFLTVVPLFAATFSLFTTGLTATQVHAAKAEIKAHIDRQTPG